jgi:hypothetical protein
MKDNLKRSFIFIKNSLFNIKVYEHRYMIGLVDNIIFLIKKKYMIVLKYLNVIEGFSMIKCMLFMKK